MHTIPPRQRATLARRIAAGLPVWAAARGSNLPAEQVGELIWEPEFRELIGAWAEILDMDPEARKQRLLKLASMVIEEKLNAGCRRTAFFVQREYARRRDPAATLAKGFSQLVELERAKAERAERLAEAAPAAAEPAPAPTPTEAAVAEAEAARRIPATAHPDDRSMWRQAGELRREMLDEQVLHHAVVRKAMLDRLLGPPCVTDLPPEPEWEAEPPSGEETEEPEPQAPPEPAPPGVSDREEAAAEPMAPDPAAAAEDGGAEEEEMSDEEFARRMTAGFNQILNGLPADKRAVLARFSQEELWALVGDLAEGIFPGHAVPDHDGDAQPQGP
jgi:hypothetical protein